MKDNTGHSLTKRHYIPKSIRIKILQKYGGKCAYCGCNLTMKTMCIDHIYPIRKGGIDNLENYNPACRECNYYKSTLDIKQFKERISTIIERLRKSFIFKLAIKYNLIEPKPFTQFYFEKITKDDQKALIADGGNLCFGYTKVEEDL